MGHLRDGGQDVVHLPLEELHRLAAGLDSSGHSRLRVARGLARCTLVVARSVPPEARKDESAHTHTPTREGGAAPRRRMDHPNSAEDLFAEEMRLPRPRSAAPPKKRSRAGAEGAPGGQLGVIVDAASIRSRILSSRIMPTKASRLDASRYSALSFATFFPVCSASST